MVSRFEMPCICTRWTGERCAEQVTMMNALFLLASCSITVIVFCSEPLGVQLEYAGSSVIFGSISAAAP